MQDILFSYFIFIFVIYLSLSHYNCTHKINSFFLFVLFYLLLVNIINNKLLYNYTLIIFKINVLTFTTKYEVLLF